MVALSSKFYDQIWAGFCLKTGNAFSQRFHFKANRKSFGSSKKRYQEFSKQFERSACFYVTISQDFKRFQQFNFETDFLENENLFQKTGVPFFQPLTLKTHHFHTKLLCQKPMLRQIEWQLQIGPITKNGVLPVTA